jgi:hypothetical protein
MHLGRAEMCRMIARRWHRSLHTPMLRVDLDNASLNPTPRRAVPSVGFIPEVEALGGGASDQTDKQNASEHRSSSLQHIQPSE